MKTHTKPKGMQVPDGYFENNKEALLHIPGLKGNAHKPAVVLLYRYVLYGLAAAAILGVLYINLSKTQEKPSFDNLDKDVLVEYLMLEGTDPAYAPSQYTSFWEETELNIETEFNLSDEHLENYLSEQNDLLFDNI